MAARALLLAIVIVVAACSGGGQSLATQVAGPSAGPSATPRATVAPGRTLGNFFPSFSAPAPTPASTDNPADLPTATFRPSGGTMLRVANFYRSAADEPKAIDVYGAYDATQGLLRATVPFGTMSDWFDPGILDDSGDANFAFYPTGTTGRDDQVGAQSETLNGTERITVMVGVGDNTGPKGTPYAQWKTYFENGTVYPIPTPPVSGTAVLLVEGIGIKALPGTTETFMYLGLDGTCLPALYPGMDGGGQPVGPDTQQQYIVPAGSHDITFHVAQQDCGGKSDFDPVHVQLDAGQQAFLMLFSPDGKALKELFVPIQH